MSSSTRHLCFNAIDARICITKTDLVASSGETNTTTTSVENGTGGLVTQGFIDSIVSVINLPLELAKR